MTSILKVNLVQYKCSCKVWSPLCQLYFCHKCNELKCSMCLKEEIDIIFCPNCMENNSTSEALQRKFRCSQCYQCPLCANILVGKGHAERQYYLYCNACQWTTKDSHIPDQASAINWPEHENVEEQTLDQVLKQMKTLGSFEKLEKTRQIQANKRRSNFTNDFGLNTAYLSRKAALQRPSSTEFLVETCSNIDELDPSIFTERVDSGNVPTLEQVLKQLLFPKDKHLYPLKVKLISRCSMRCVKCETNLYKSEYSPNVIRPKMKSFGVDHIPDIKISRKFEFISEVPSFFLILSNNSVNSMEILLSGIAVENDKNYIDCSNYKLNVSVPGRDDTADIDDFVRNGDINRVFDSVNERNDKIVFMRRHRVGIVVDCSIVTAFNSESYTYFNMEYWLTEDNTKSHVSNRIKVCLGKTL